MNQIDQIYRQTFDFDTTGQFSSARMVCEKHSLPQEEMKDQIIGTKKRGRLSSLWLKIKKPSLLQEASDQNKVGNKKKESIVNKPNFLRKIFACYVKDNIREERDTDNEQNNIDRRSSVENGESFSPTAERSDFNKNKNMENAEEQPKPTRPTLQEDNDHLSYTEQTDQNEEKIQRQRRRVAKSHSYPLQLEQTSLSGTMDDQDKQLKVGGKTSKKRLLTKSASCEPRGYRRQYSAAGGAHLRSPMLRYLSSSGGISSKAPSTIQTVYFSITANSGSPVVAPEKDGVHHTAAELNQQNMDVKSPSHTNPKSQFQMPKKFLENIEQAKKDFKTSVAVYRVQCERKKIKVFQSNALVYQKSNEEKTRDGWGL